MPSPSARFGAVLASLALTASALEGIVVPNQVAADMPFQITFENANSDQFRVYLAAALVGANGPACYITNSTVLSSPATLTIPADVGPDADYYTIAIGDLTTHQGVTYSNRFDLTGGTGTYSTYENHLGGAAFWSADALPCTAYSCARQCAQAGYPDDLTQNAAYDTMQKCILQCPGVTPTNTTTPAHAASASSASGAQQALVTLAPNMILTAMETFVTKGSSTMEEAILGSVTLTLGGAEATISGHAVSLGSSGVKVGSTTTVAFASASVSATGMTDNQATSASSTGVAASTSSAAAVVGKQPSFAAAVMGLAGVAMML